MRVYGYRCDKLTWVFLKLSCCVICFWVVVFLQYEAVKHRDPEEADFVHYKGFRHMSPDELPLKLDKKSNANNDYIYIDTFRKDGVDEDELKADDIPPRRLRYGKNVNDLDKEDKINAGHVKDNIGATGDQLPKHVLKEEDGSRWEAKETLRARKLENLKVKFTLNQLVPLSPMDAPGEFGIAVNINNSRLSKEDQILMADGYNKTGFNKYVSDMISLRRRAPDLRPDVCRRLQYPDDLPSTSVIICFHNEAWSTLLRTVFSVLDKSPTHLIHEIILVDDFSYHSYLNSSQVSYLQKLPKVRLVRASSRLGLIGCRLLGAVSVTTPIITFLDSHVECMIGWLEPMLNSILENDYTVPFPVIDGINTDDFTFTRVMLNSHGLLNWIDLGYVPSPLPEKTRRKSSLEPIDSPIMPGGIFSISRRYFDLLGRYDPGLKTWGSENIELSVKVWLCNGTVKRLPCSHVGHIFRSYNPNLGNDFIDILHYNAMRVAYVWMDEYKYLFFNNVVEDDKQQPGFGDVTKRVKLRQQLHCKNFDWYMKNIATEIYSPVKAFAIKQIINVKYTEICIGHSPFEERIITGRCKMYPPAVRLWYFDNGQLMSGVLGKEKQWTCLSAEKGKMFLTQNCNRGQPGQQWTYSADNTLRNVWLRKCIELTPKHNARLADCSGETAQMWSLPRPSYKLDLPIT